ncbi:hypothetical protein SISNIDRAFT_491903, partial [Sistotremastrum niveocremeum HHB9708]
AFHHNRGIADSAYATSADDHESSREAPFETYLRVSFLLHDWYGIGAHVPPHPLSVSTAESAVTHPDLLVLSRSVDDRLLRLANELRNTIVLAADRGIRSAINSIPPISSSPAPRLPNPRSMVHPSRLYVLRHFLAVSNPSQAAELMTSAGFRTPEQADLIDHILSQPGHLLAVLPTGGGKTMAIAAAAKLYEKVSALIVVMVPFVALQHDLYYRLRAYASTARFEADDWNPFTTKILLISLECLTERKNFTKLLSFAGHIKAIFIDEAHHLLISKQFRPRFADLHQLIAFGCPVILLTGTLSPTSVSTLQNQLHLGDLRQIRSPTTARPELRFNFERCSRERLHPAVREYIRLHPSTAQERGMVICRTKKDAEALAAATGAVLYHAGMSPELRIEAMNRWLNGAEPQSRWIIGTKALSTGVDYPHVRWVILVEALDTIIDTDQAGGRGGRDGDPAEVTIFFTGLPQRFPDSDPDELLHGGYDVVCRMLSESDVCHRLHRNVFLDGVPSTCADLIGSKVQLCPPCHNAFNTQVDFFAIAQAENRPVIPFAAISSPTNPPRILPPPASNRRSPQILPTDDDVFSPRPSLPPPFSPTSQFITSHISHSRPRTPPPQITSDFIANPDPSPYASAVKRTATQTHHTPQSIQKRIRVFSPHRASQSFRSPPPPSTPTKARSQPSPYPNVSRQSEAPLPFSFQSSQATQLSSNTPSSSFYSSQSSRSRTSQPTATQGQRSSSITPAQSLTRNDLNYQMTKFVGPARPMSTPDRTQARRDRTSHDQSLPPTASMLSAKDREIILRQQCASAETNTLLRELDRTWALFRRQTWQIGCTVEWVVTNLGISGYAQEQKMGNHNTLKLCRLNYFTAEQRQQWRSWQNDLSKHLLNRKDYCYKCLCPIWASTEIVHWKALPPHDFCSDWARDMWVMIWSLSDRMNYIASVSAPSPPPALNDRSDYQIWLTTLVDPNSRLINGWVLIHTFVRLNKLIPFS